MANKSKSKKIKVPLLQEAKTIGYIEGYHDGINETIEKLKTLKLLTRGWEKIYNKN